MKKWLKRIAFVLTAIFAGIQFVRPARTNPPIDRSQVLRAPAHVQPILDRACNDCHSSATTWPWYSHVAPLSWYLVDHVNEGRKQVSFSEWETYAREDQAHVLEEICEEVEKGEMPLAEYTWLHPSAQLSEADKRTLCTWAESERLRVRAAAGQDLHERPRT